MPTFTNLTAAWITAMHRAHDQHLFIRRVDDGSDDDHQTYAVSSSGAAYHEYAVRLDCGPNGVDVSCDCPAGQNDRPCKHCAKVLLYTGHIVMPNPQRSLFDAPRVGLIATTRVHRSTTEIQIDGRTALALLNGEDA